MAEIVGHSPTREPKRAMTKLQPDRLLLCIFEPQQSPHTVSCFSRQHVITVLKAMGKNGLLHWMRGCLRLLVLRLSKPASDGSF